MLDIKDAVVYLTIARFTDATDTPRVKNDGEFESDLQSIESGRHRQLHENHSAKMNEFGICVLCSIGSSAHTRGRMARKNVFLCCFENSVSFGTHIA